MDVLQVLLVDDEPFIVESIGSLLEGHAGMSIEIHRAYSAASAMRIMTQWRIDIMICDINMPGISGLQLAHQVRIQWPFCRVMILTAYADFEYSQEALRAGVIDYVLKTDSDDKIIKSFLNCVEHLRRDVLSFGRLNGSTGTDSILYENALQSILRRETAAAQRLSLLQSLGYLTNSTLGYRLVIGHGNQTSTQSSPDDIRASAPAFLFSKSDFSHVCCLEFSVVWLFQTRSTDLDDPVFADRLSGVFELFCQHLRATKSYAVHFLISRPIYDPEQIPQELVYLKETAEKMRIDPESFVRTLSEGDYNSDSDLHGQLIQRIGQYIEDNIFNGVSLSSISSFIGYNPSYLSKLYQINTGKLLSEYIFERKLHHISALLKHDDLSLRTVAEMAGYDTQSSFNRFIRRMTGLTPGLLRDQLLAESKKATK